jgi:peptidoglycan/LPS O-acetylase OafA/YrhL
VSEPNPAPRLEKLARDRLPELDLCRFAAALAVTVFHYAYRGSQAEEGFTAFSVPFLIPVAKYGYLGVELFFMISGFVILMTAQGASARSFLVSRATRLYPTFFICCGLTFLVTTIFGNGAMRVSYRDFLWNTLFLWSKAGGKPVDPVYWTLLLEIRFYAFVFVLILFGQTHRFRQFLFLWLGVCLALEAFPHAPGRFLLLFGYSQYFLAGALFFSAFRDGFSVALVGALFFCHALALRQVMLGTVAGGPLNPMVLAVVITGFFVLLAVMAVKKAPPLPAGPWTFLGLITYPLYLLHDYIGFVFFNHAPFQGHPMVLLAMAVTGVLVLASAVQQGVDRFVNPPFKKGLRRLLLLGPPSKSGLAASSPTVPRQPGTSPVPADGGANPTGLP